MSKALTADFIRKAKPGKYRDGGKQGQGHLSTYGLRLEVSTYGRKRFVQRLWWRGQQRDIALGSADLITLKEARDMARTNWATARKGGDPRRKQQSEQQAEVIAAGPTFAEAAADTELTANAMRRLQLHAFPLLTDMAVGEVKPADVLKVVQVLWADKRATATKLLGSIVTVIDRAKVQGHRADTITAKEVTAALPRNGATTKHQPAMAHSEVSKALAALGEGKAACMIRFQCLTAVRPIEAQCARWQDIDLDAGVWSLQADAKKERRSHRVPLSSQALALLGEAKAHSDGDSVFSGTAVAKASQVKRAMRKLGIASDFPGRPAVAHGFRSSFRDWAGELSGASHDVIEKALAHTVGNSVTQAYYRSDLLEQRRELMQAWADYLTG